MKFSAAAVLSLGLSTLADAFVVQRLSASPSIVSSSAVITRPPRSTSSSAQWMADESSGAGDYENNVETEAQQQEQQQQQQSSAEAAEAEQQQQEVEEEEEEAKEDPEMVAIKEEIAALEATLKEKRRELAYTSDQAEEFSKSGYARKVAEMETMRRGRSMMASSNKSGAMAGVLATFLPILDTLGELQEKYGHDEFGKSYNALPSIMQQVYTDLGAVEYSIAAGDAVDPNRMNVVETVYSDEYPANTVIQPLTLGLDMQGNVIRAAQCVASLGPEKAMEEEQQPPVDAPAEDEATE